MDTLNTEFSLLVGRMDAKLDILLTRSDSHELRIGILEANTNSNKGAMKIAVVAAGAIGALFMALLPTILHMV